MKRSLEVLKSEETVAIAGVAATVRQGESEKSKAVVASGLEKKGGTTVS